MLAIFERDLGNRTEYREHSTYEAYNPAKYCRGATFSLAIRKLPKPWLDLIFDLLTNVLLKHWFIYILYMAEPCKWFLCCKDFVVEFSFCVGLM